MAHPCPTIGNFRVIPLSTVMTILSIHAFHIALTHKFLTGSIELYLQLSGRRMTEPFLGVESPRGRSHMFAQEREGSEGRHSTSNDCGSVSSCHYLKP
jgi:hypothetical protein